MSSWDLIGNSIVRAMAYLFVATSSFSAMTLITAAAPGFMRRIRSNARQSMRACFLWGLVFSLNAVLVAALLRLLDGILGNALALVVMVGLLVIALSGLAAISSEVGVRVFAIANRNEASPLACVTVGTLILFSTAVIPVLGWLVFAGALLTGIGAFLETAAEDYRPSKSRTVSQLSSDLDQIQT